MIGSATRTSDAVDRVMVLSVHLISLLFWVLIYGGLAAGGE